MQPKHLSLSVKSNNLKLIVSSKKLPRDWVEESMSTDILSFCIICIQDMLLQVVVSLQQILQIPRLSTCG
jgi:hypothetical protein